MLVMRFVLSGIRFVRPQAIPVKKDEKKAQVQEIKTAKEAALEASKLTVRPAIEVTIGVPSTNEL